VTDAAGGPNLMIEICVSRSGAFRNTASENHADALAHPRHPAVIGLGCGSRSTARPLMVAAIGQKKGLCQRWAGHRPPDRPLAAYGLPIEVAQRPVTTR
jgi:hypothetical protein